MSKILPDGTGECVRVDRYVWLRVYKVATRNIIVIGASAGGFEALKKLVGGLPKDFDASIFIVRHMSPDVRGVLPQVLNRAGNDSRRARLRRQRF